MLSSYQASKNPAAICWCDRRELLLARGCSARENEGMDEKPERRRFQLGLRTAFELITLIAIALAWLYARDPQQVPVQQPSSDARYQLHSYQPFGSSGEQLMLLDTQTGQCWRESGKSWREEIRPLPER